MMSKNMGKTTAPGCVCVCVRVCVCVCTGGESGHETS